MDLFFFTEAQIIVEIKMLDRKVNFVINIKNIVVTVCSRLSHI